MQGVHGAAPVAMKPAHGTLRTEEVEDRCACMARVGCILSSGVGQLREVLERIGDEEWVTVSFDEVAAFDVVEEAEGLYC